MWTGDIDVYAESIEEAVEFLKDLDIETFGGARREDPCVVAFTQVEVSDEALEKLEEFWGTGAIWSLRQEFEDE